jgi:hypothetical protein
MTPKIGQRVRVWNGDFGKVLAVFDRQAKLYMDSRMTKSVPFDQIVAAIDTITPKRVKFEAAQDKLGAFKREQAALSRLAPGKVDEDKWDEAKAKVKKQRNKNISDFSDRDWGLVNTIYQNMGGTFGSKKSRAEQYSIEDTGLRKLEKGLITIQPNTIYFMGASSSPDMIIVTDADDDFITYTKYPHYKSQRIQRVIGEDLIKQGTETWLNSGYPEYQPELADSLKRMLAGEEGDTVNPADYQRVKMIAKPAEGHEGEDLWYEAEQYGSVGMNTQTGEYTIVGQRSNARKLEENDKFEVISVEDYSGGSTADKTKVAGHPKETDTKYAVGDILTPAEGTDKTHQIHVLDVTEDGKTYVIEQRPMNDVEEGQDEQTYGVRYEIPVSTLDKDKDWRRYGSNYNALPVGEMLEKEKARRAEVGERTSALMPVEEDDYPRADNLMDTLKVGDKIKWVAIDGGGVGTIKELSEFKSTVDYKTHTSAVVERDGDGTIHQLKWLEHFSPHKVEGRFNITTKKAARWSMNKMEQFLAQKNEEDGTAFELGGAYGNYELWANGNRLEAGSLDDVYQAWIKNRFNEKYKKQSSLSKKPKMSQIGISASKQDDDGLKSPVRKQYDYGELEWKKGELETIKEAGNTVVLSFKDCDVTYGLDGKFISAVNRDTGDSVEIADGFRKEFGSMVANAGVTKIHAAITQRRIANKLAALAGRTTTPKYRLETGKSTPMEWKCEYGKPTPENIEKWVRRFNKSLQPGGVNEHVGVDATVSNAKVVDQETDEVVAEWSAPAFDVMSCINSVKSVFADNRISEAGLAKIAALRKKAERLGNWDFDKHDPIWVLEAAEDGSQKIKRK